MRPTFTRSTLMFWLAVVSVLLGALVAARAYSPAESQPHSPLITATQTATQTSTPTRTRTATMCPVATPEQLRVESVTSPTNLLTQTITIGIGNGDAVTVTAESGVFTATGNFNAYNNPAFVTMTLFADTIHHLLVQAHVRLVPGPGGCQYGDYTLSTTVDRFGAPLTIVQQTGGGTPTPTPPRTSTATITPTGTPSLNAPIYLPLVFHSALNHSCDPTPIPTETPVLPLGRQLVTQPPCPTPTITLTPFPTATPSCLGPATATVSPPLSAPRLITPLPTCTPRPTSTPAPTVTGTPPTPVPTHTFAPP